MKYKNPICSILLLFYLIIPGIIQAQNTKADGYKGIWFTLGQFSAYGDKYSGGLGTNSRIFQPLMTKHHGFMGANADGRRPNNWNPWIHYAPEGGKTIDFDVIYNPAQFDVTVEKVGLAAMEDKGVLQRWGDTIHRINFKAKTQKKSDKYNFRISLK